MAGVCQHCAGEIRDDAERGPSCKDCRAPADLGQLGARRHDHGSLRDGPCYGCECGALMPGFADVYCNLKPDHEGDHHAIWRNYTVGAGEQHTPSRGQSDG